VKSASPFPNAADSGNHHRTSVFIVESMEGKTPSPKGLLAINSLEPEAVLAQGNFEQIQHPGPECEYDTETSVIVEVNFSRKMLTDLFVGRPLLEGFWACCSLRRFSRTALTLAEG
jgi:hypothetical protein